MGKFYVAGCFADNIIVDKDRDKIEKKAGGPAHFIKNVFDELGEDYEVAKGKKGIVEIHIENGEESGRFPRACKVSSAPIASSIVLAFAISDEVCLDKLKGDFGQVYADTRGFVRDPENFGGKRNWCIKNVEKIKVLKTTPLEMQYLPENLLSHLRENGVIIISKGEGRMSLLDCGEETQFQMPEMSASEAVGGRETFFAAFASEYSKGSDAKKAMEFAIDYSKKFLSGENKSDEDAPAEE